MSEALHHSLNRLIPSSVGRAVGAAVLVAGLTGACSGDSQEAQSSPPVAPAVAPPTSTEKPTIDPETERGMARYGNYYNDIYDLQERGERAVDNRHRLLWLAKIACFKGKDPNSSDKQWQNFQKFLSNGYAEAWRDLYKNLKETYVPSGSIIDATGSMPRVPRTLQGARDTFPVNATPVTCEDWAIDHGLKRGDGPAG